jgi:hypothetical protein
VTDEQQHSRRDFSALIAYVIAGAVFVVLAVSLVGTWWPS